jgi:hypothetical protein
LDIRGILNNKSFRFYVIYTLVVTMLLNLVRVLDVGGSIVSYSTVASLATVACMLCYISILKNNKIMLLFMIMYVVLNTAYGVLRGNKLGAALGINIIFILIGMISLLVILTFKKEVVKLIRMNKYMWVAIIALWLAFVFKIYTGEILSQFSNGAFRFYAAAAATIQAVLLLNIVFLLETTVGFMVIMVILQGYTAVRLFLINELSITAFVTLLIQTITIGIVVYKYVMSVRREKKDGGN